MIRFKKKNFYNGYKVYGLPRKKDFQSTAANNLLFIFYLCGKSRDTSLLFPPFNTMKPMKRFFTQEVVRKRLIGLSLLLCGFLFYPVNARQPPSCRVALVQAELDWGNVDANLSAFGKRVEACRGCELIVFPELFTSGCEMKKRTAASAPDTKQKIAARYEEILEKMKTWAAASGALIIGSTIYASEGKYYNRLLAVFPDGHYRYYDKHNCFKKGSFTPGDSQLILEWKGHRIATYICYDLRFPAWSRNEGNYDTALYIANWPASRRDDWNRLLRARAEENQAYILAVNCAGTDPAGLAYAGDSGLLAPDGEWMGKCEPYREEILRLDF